MKQKKEGGAYNPFFYIYFSWRMFVGFLIFFLFFNFILDTVIARFTTGLLGELLFNKLGRDVLVLTGASFLLAFFSTFLYGSIVTRLLNVFSEVLMKLCSDMLDGKYDFVCADKSCYELLKKAVKYETFKQLGLKISSIHNGFKEELAHLEREMKKKKKIFEDQSEYVAIMSHKLRTPISAVRWNLEMLLGGEFGALKPKQKEILEDAASANGKTITLVDELLKISRLESGKESLKVESFSLKEAIDADIESFMFKIKAHNVEIVRRYPHSDIKIQTDRKFFDEIMRNFIDNAVKYSAVSGRRGAVEIGYRQESANKIGVWVRDNGVGIPEKERKHLFQKFFRASNVLSLDTEGSGLGLFICRKLARLIRARIDFTSKAGEGSVFSLYLPISSNIRGNTEGYEE
ncbi:MAG: integral membrane sensor signal transduction histidine kinase [Parcubacteria group bacterium Gr01-1014_18]|nr:MAG: integral membrane sensor signal transduction histidine kinase [Parcubacteria group bacterium Greene0416_36]TSC80935.1 MAG: integral membrane sensor signal transduction histidine kinase [Parcubacteria group bacterium Gr01-1014_18]TSC98722.1 MAG: integral membrane sensor signal transduction histidine kinase [Parcubacteria group bacterium Greene1014_20]TSD06474.1 MAG: integral membrane sensor signal transduction histidine kinase [Parcubacteria group bacterium Greene0714_2]